jgi:nucleotide-binding universal stress UspA family protein
LKDSTQASCGDGLILMASHGRRGTGLLLRGSGTPKLLMYSTLQVLAWRPHADKKN